LTATAAFPPGRYRVNILHDERGNSAGAELMRIDVEGPPWPTRLTAAQWGFETFRLRLAQRDKDRIFDFS
jgi:hypothetical protein